MNSIIDRQEDQFKVKYCERKMCVGKGCPNEAVDSLEINFVKKPGYFCNRCATDLLKLDLVKSTTSISNDTSNYYSTASLTRKSRLQAIQDEDSRRSL